MSKKIKKIAAAGLLGVVALASQPASANIPFSMQEKLMGNNALCKQINRIDQGLLAAISAHNKRTLAPWNNGNVFVDAFGNGSWGRMI